MGLGTMEITMANTPKVLKDLTQLSNEALMAELQSRGLTASSGKEDKVFVADYTPKKGKDAGKTVKRLFVQGNFYPLVIGQAACSVMAENFDTIAKFGKEGK